MSAGRKVGAIGLLALPALAAVLFAVLPVGSPAVPLGCVPRPSARVAPRAASSLELAAELQRAWTPLAASDGRQPSAFVFWEAEHARASSYPAQNPFAPAGPAEAEVLSGGAWIGAHAPSTEQFLEYDVSVPEPGRYTFYVRKFWQHGPFRFRFDEQPWADVGSDVALLDAVVLRPKLVANWVQAGEVELGAGPHVLRIEISKEYASGVSAWDAFLLTRDEFVPRGKLRPGAKWGTAREGFFAFEPDADRFEPAELDLRTLNAPVAGDQGFVVARGQAFVLERSGERVRFWGVNVSESMLALPPSKLRYLARHLAKRGVNLVRVMAHFQREDELARIDEKKLERLHAAVAELKQAGIYTQLAIYFPLEFRPEARHGFAGYTGDKSAFGLLFVNDALAATYRGWWRQILGTKSAVTGRSLLEEPALAALELVNEDSTLFWTFQPYASLPAEQMPPLERKFGAWLAERHGSVAKALAALGGDARRGDDASQGRVGLAELSAIVASDGARERGTAQFLATLLRDFYARTYGYVKRELGFRGSVACSNWITADARRLDPLEKWANSACDFMDRHGYYSGPHLGESASYLVSKGDRYDDASALCFDSDSEEQDRPKLDLPIRDVHYGNKPSTISELNWTPPNRFRAELPFLAAAYGSLQDTSAFVFFTVNEPGFAQIQSKFSVSDPALLGQFPAAAVMYRNGYVRVGANVVELELSLSDLFALEGSPLAGSSNLDLLRKLDLPSRQAAAGDARAIDPLFYLAGRSHVSFHPVNGSARITDLSTFLDAAGRKVTSTTRELVWDYGRGVVRLEAARAVGVAGFLGSASPLELRALRLETPLEYGVVLLVSLDGAPLESSKKMLLQLMSELENGGFAAPGRGLRVIADAGRPPLAVRKLAGRVHFTRPDAGALRAFALDANGYATHRAELSNGLPLLPNALHYIVYRD